MRGDYARIWHLVIHPFIRHTNLRTYMRDLRLELDNIKPSICMTIGETKTISQSGKKYIKVHYILKSN